MILTRLCCFNPLSPHDASNHRHPLQVKNCDSNSRLVVDEDDNDKFRLERDNNTWRQCKSMMILGCFHKITNQNCKLMVRLCPRCCTHVNIGFISFFYDVSDVSRISGILWWEEHRKSVCQTMVVQVWWVLHITLVLMMWCMRQYLHVVHETVYTCGACNQFSFLIL